MPVTWSRRQDRAGQPTLAEEVKGWWKEEHVHPVRRVCACKNTSPLTHTFSHASTWVLAASYRSKVSFFFFFFFCHAFWPHFCRERKEENQKHPLCSHQFDLNCMRRWRCSALLFGGTSPEISALPRGLSRHGWLLPTHGQHVDQAVHEKGGHITAPPWGLLPSPHRERPPQFTFHADSDIRRPTGTFYSYLHFVPSE